MILCGYGLDWFFLCVGLGFVYYVVDCVVGDVGVVGVG